MAPWKLDAEKKPKVVVITGASAGVGRATAQAFAELGSSIGLVARGRDGLEAARRDVEARGGRGLVLPVDVSDAAAVESPSSGRPSMTAARSTWAGRLSKPSWATSSPRDGSTITSRTCYEAQMTDEPDDPTRPNNLWEPVPGDHGAHGAFDDRSQRWSWQLWADLHRQWIALAGAGLAGLGVGLCSRRFPSRLPGESLRSLRAGKLIQNVQAMIAKCLSTLMQSTLTKSPGRESLFPSKGRGNSHPEMVESAIASARKLLTNRSYGVSYHLCSG